MMSILSVQSDEHFMKLALDQAKIAYDEGEIPVGAVVVSHNKVIAKAYNQTEKLNDVTAHAEMLAITAAQNYLNSKYLTECTLYVTLEPCTMCAGALYWSQIARVFFGASDDGRGYHLINPAILHPKTELRTGLLANESSELIKSFFRKMRGNNS